MKTKDTRYAIVLVGGMGSRLWPMSRENYPKQFVEFQDGLSLFQLTVKRLMSSFPAQNIVIVAGEKYKFTINNQIEMLEGLSKEEKFLLQAGLVLEPAARNTLPAILLGVRYLDEKRSLADDDLVYVFPSDHIIEPIGAFKRSLIKARAVALSGHIVTFGVKPTHPKEGYGYVIPRKNGEVERFVEKPSAKKAAALIKQGAFWNAGIFCFTKRVFLEEIKEHQPVLSAQYALPFEVFLKGFSALPKDSIDYGIMQKTRRAAVVRFEPKWSDLGSWDSLMDFYARGRKNFSIGESELVDCEDCLVYSKQRLVSLVGIKDVIVVNSPDSLLVIKRGESDKVKGMVERLMEKKSVQVKDSPTVHRPWGYYTVLEDRPGYKVKEIGVYPGKAISLQKHLRRSEHWNVVEGKAYIIVGNQRMEVAKNQSAYVPKNTKHKLYNPGKILVKMIEVQIGEYLEEDDIVRYDSYE